jgi:hypothetical protein
VALQTKAIVFRTQILTTDTDEPYWHTNSTNSEQAQEMISSLVD